MTQEVVYVGKGKGKRAWSHLSGSTNPRLENLIKKRQIEGFDMQPEIIASTPSEENSFLIEKRHFCIENLDSTKVTIR